MTRLHVDTPDTLITFLLRRLVDVKRNTVKSRLRHGAVFVNGVPTTNANTMLAEGDLVELRREGGGPIRDDGLRVLLVDDHLIVIEKPGGLLTVPSHRPGTNERTAVELAAEQLRTDRPLFACHRLDRESSGALLLARTETIRSRFFASWSNVEKRYAVLVEGNVVDDEGTISAPLYENPRSKAVHVSRRPEAKDATTHFRVQERGRKRTLLEVLLETGRRHQIRAHLAHLGHPVTGDPRYGSGKRGAPRMCLHSSRLAFVHPVTSEAIVVESRAPELFAQLCRSSR